MGSLGEPRKTKDLSWLRTPGTKHSEHSKDIPDSQPDKETKDIQYTLPIAPSKVKQVVEPSVVSEDDEVIQFSMRIRRSVAMRIYSEKFHDPEQRPIQEVVAEILDQGLAMRPDKGPAPPSLIAKYKSMGKKRKT